MSDSLAMDTARMLEAAARRLRKYEPWFSDTRKRELMSETRALMAGADARITSLAPADTRARSASAPPSKRNTYEPPSHLIELADELLTESQQGGRDSKSDEFISHCLLCDQWDDHSDDCPIPALKKWLDDPR